jgi:hypothetical protein
VFIIAGYNTHQYETSMMYETHTIVATPSLAGCSIISSPSTYDGIGANEYIEWKSKIDNILYNVVCMNEEKLL